MNFQHPDTPRQRAIDALNYYQRCIDRLNSHEKSDTVDGRLILIGWDFLELSRLTDEAEPAQREHLRCDAEYRASLIK